MPRLLNKIYDPAKDVSNFNTNFDRISLDIADSRGTFSSLASTGAVTVASNTALSIEVNVIDNLKLYSKNTLPIIPRVLVYIDTDGDGTYIYPSGSSLTSTQVRDISVDVLTSTIVLNEVTNEKATYNIILRNLTGSSVDFYVYTDCFYVPGPDSGVANRV